MTSDQARSILASLAMTAPHLAGEHAVLVEWRNPYSEPPNGKPRELGVVICKPWETCIRLGTGWCTAFLGRIGEVLKEPRRFTPERKGRMRLRNLQRRAEAKAPLFASDIVAEAVAERPDYFAGK